MLVCCDADATEVWVGAEDAWDLDVSTPAAEQPAASAATADAVASQAAALERAPILPGIQSIGIARDGSARSRERGRRPECGCATR
jgi:hypothetical protein